MFPELNDMKARIWSTTAALVAAADYGAAGQIADAEYAIVQPGLLPATTGTEALIVLDDTGSKIRGPDGFRSASFYVEAAPLIGIETHDLRDDALIGALLFHGLAAKSPAVLVLTTRRRRKSWGKYLKRAARRPVIELTQPGAPPFSETTGGSSFEGDAAPSNTDSAAPHPR